MNGYRLTRRGRRLVRVALVVIAIVLFLWVEYATSLPQCRTWGTVPAVCANE